MERLKVLNEKNSATGFTYCGVLELFRTYKVLFPSYCVVKIIYIHISQTPLIFAQSPDIYLGILITIQ